MKKLFAALAFGAAMFAAPLASAQQAGVPLQVRAGEVYTLRFEGTETIIAGGEETTVPFGAVYALEILSDAPSDRRWRYTPISVDYSGFANASPELSALAFDWNLLNEGLSATVRLFADIGFECRVDEYGRCIEMTNWPMWSARVENIVLAGDAFARMVQASDASTATETPKAGGMAEADSGTWQSGDQAPWTALREPILRGVSALLDGVDTRSAATAVSSFHPLAAVQGRSMARGEAQSFVEEWAMPYGAAPLNVTGTLTLDRIDRRANTATFVRRASLEPAAVRAALQSMSDYMITRVIEPTRPYLGADADSLPTPEGMQALVQMFLPQLNVSFEETTTGVVDLTTGMARQTTSDFVITMAGAPETPELAATVRARYVLTVERGAPATPRLPRAN
jgi:hypothetical protein